MNSRIYIHDASYTRVDSHLDSSKRSFFSIVPAFKPIILRSLPLPPRLRDYSSPRKLLSLSLSPSLKIARNTANAGMKSFCYVKTKTECVPLSLTRDRCIYRRLKATVPAPLRLNSKRFARVEKRRIGIPIAAGCRGCSLARSLALSLSRPLPGKMVTIEFIN